MIFKEQGREWRGVGRDIIRVLRALKVPELDFVWGLLKGTPAGDKQPLMDSLLAFPTPAALITANVTPIMEQQLVFLMTQV
jgi:hypothetical protein